MIRVNFSGSIFFFFLLLLFSSCSSPGNDGVELGEKFCNCLGDFKTFKDPNQFKQVMDSCEESIKVDWTKFESDYKKNESDWNIFVASYEKAREVKLKEFNTALTAVYSEIEKNILEKLHDKLWIKKDENKGYYLYTFSDSTLSIVNCVGETNFELSLDTIKFADAESTKALISFTEDGNLILSDCNSDKKGVYQMAVEKDKLLGSWSVKGGISVSFYPGGNCSVTQGWNTQNTRYTLNGNRLEIDGPPAYSINLSNINYFSFGQAQFSRNRRGQPKNLNIIFSRN